MLLILYILLMVSSTGMLIFGIKLKSWLPCFLATILFAVCSFQAFTLEITNDAGTFIAFTDPVFVGLGMFGMFVGLIFTMVGSIHMLGERKKKKANAE